LSYKNKNIEDLVCEAYSIEKFKTVYSRTIYPVKDPKFCPAIKFFPSLSPSPIPKKRRRPPKDNKGCGMS